MSDNISILVGMYNDLERRYKDAGLSTYPLEVTAGVELFDTDYSHFPPGVDYVLSSLAKAEDDLNRHLSGQPSKIRERLESTYRRLLLRRVVNILVDYINTKTPQEEHKPK